MEDVGDKPASGRVTARVIDAIAWFNIIAACLYLIVGVISLGLAFYMTEVEGGRVGSLYVSRGLYGLLMVGYAILLVVTASGLLRRTDWGWRLGMMTAILSVGTAVLAALRASWAAVAFDVAYGSIAAGCLLAVRRA